MSPTSLEVQLHFHGCLNRTLVRQMKLGIRCETSIFLFGGMYIQVRSMFVGGFVQIRSMFVGDCVEVTSILVGGFVQVTLMFVGGIVQVTSMFVGGFIQVSSTLVGSCVCLRSPPSHLNWPEPRGKLSTC